MADDMDILIHTNGSILLPEMARILTQKVMIKYPAWRCARFCVEMGKSQSDAWESCGIQVQKAHDRVDTMSDNLISKTFAGFPINIIDNYPVDQVSIVDENGKILGKIINLAVPEFRSVSHGRRT
jgi:hypothetical protein